MRNSPFFELAVVHIDGSMNEPQIMKRSQPILSGVAGARQVGKAKFDDQGDRWIAGDDLPGTFQNIELRAFDINFDEVDFGSAGYDIV